MTRKPWSELEHEARKIAASGGYAPYLGFAIAEIDRLRGLMVEQGPPETASHRIQFYGGEHGGKQERQRREVETRPPTPTEATLAEQDRRLVETWIREHNVRAAQRAVNQANSAAADALDPPSVKKPSPGRAHPIDDGHLEGPTLTLQSAIGRGAGARRFRHIATLPLGTTWPSALEKWASIIDVIGMKQTAGESFSVSVAATALGNVVVTFHACAQTRTDVAGFDFSFLYRGRSAAAPTALDRGATATWPLSTHVIREPRDVHSTPTGQEKGD